MSTGRFIIAVIGFILLLIIITSGGKFAANIRNRLNKYLPSQGQTKGQQINISPSPTLKLSPTPTITYSGKSTPANEVPATGPRENIFALLILSFILGLSLKRKFTYRKS